jgi:small conductance mechanosensitive channel
MPDVVTLLTIACLFAGAWIVSRGAAYVARLLLLWHDRHTEAAAATDAVRIDNVKRRETTVAVVRATIAYAAFGFAVVLSVAQLTGGLSKLSTIAGASFLLILAGFAIQRVLMDVIAGLMMFAESWYHVGDTIAIPTLELQGVVEDVSLRRTKLRTLDGETIQVSNSQIPAVRVLPTGLKDLAVELFVSDREPGERLVFRFRLRATVAPGREWLVEGFLSDLLKERAGAGLIVHGPVVLTLDEVAARSFARASAATRWSARPSPSPTG